MWNAMSLTRFIFNKDTAIILSISLCLFTIVNFVFVYNSPGFVKLIPSSVVRYISPCYRTLFNYDGESLAHSNFVFGDSFSEGAGDEFLTSDPEYGIFNKLKNTASSELIFGRGGYGNIGTVVEFEQCFPLLSSFTNFPLQNINAYNVTFVFYEGNDLNNNLVEEKREVNELFYKTRFFFPLYGYLYKVTKRELRAIYRKVRSDDPAPERQLVLPITRSGIEIQRYPQSAATELSETELERSINLLFDSILSARELLPNAQRYGLLYLPSVASSYHIDGDIRVQSYQGRDYFETSGAFNANRSKQIRESIEERISNLGWHFCDTTPAILSKSDEGEAVHGPVDWKHFNKAGYSVVAQTFNQCFNK